MPDMNLTSYSEGIIKYLKHISADCCLVELVLQPARLVCRSPMMMWLLNHHQHLRDVGRSLQDGISANIYHLCGGGFSKMDPTMQVLMAGAVLLKE